MIRRERHEAELVDDQEIVAGELLLQAQEPLLVARLDEFVDQGGGGGEADPEALLAGGEDEAERDVGLAGAAGPERDEVLAARDVLAAGELEDQGLVERGDGLEVEAIQALASGEAGGPDAPLDEPLLAVDQLELGEAQEIADMVDAFARTPPRLFVVLAQEGRQLERLEVMLKEQLRRLGHGRAADSRLI
jgi:hypothetical protein